MARRNDTRAALNERDRSCNASVMWGCARWAAAVVSCAIVVVIAPAPCFAQSMMPSRPPVPWIGLGRRTAGDAAGRPGNTDHVGELALEPLRLSLLGNHPWTPLDAMSGCRDQLADVRSGSAPAGFMTTYAMNLLGGPGLSWKMPRLTLFGFSRGGCTLDGAAGGGATFIVPFRQDIFFVASAGAIYLPATGPTATAVQSTSMRGDVVFRRPDGRSFSLGLGSSRGLSGIRFGGVF